MRRLKTLNRDAVAREQVGLAQRQAQSGDHMDFGLLCYERGRIHGRDAAYQRGYRAGLEAAAVKADQWARHDGKRTLLGDAIRTLPTPDKEPT